MSRRREVPKREVTPDPKYLSETVAKFITVVMKSGKKSVAEKIVYGALDPMAERSKKDPIELFNQALTNVRSGRQTALAMRWVVEAARTRSGKSMAARMADELMDAADKRGNAVKKREDVHRMAEANKAFSHYRW